MYSVTYVLMIMSPLVAGISLALAIIYIVLAVQAKKANLSVYDLLIWPVWFVPCMCSVVSVLAMAGTFLDEQAGTLNVSLFVLLGRFLFLCFFAVGFNLLLVAEAKLYWRADKIKLFPYLSF